MDDTQAVNSVQSDGGGQASQADSATAEQAANSSPEQPEKAKISQDDQNKPDSEGREGEEREGGENGEEQSIPYSRFKEVNDQLKELKSQLDQQKGKAEVADRIKSALDENPQGMDPRLQKANETLRNLGYATREDVQEMLQRERLVSEWRQQMTDLESKYDGSDGGVKFDPESVAKYMEENNIYDPETAFKVMNLDAIVDQKAKDKRKTAYSDKQGTPVHDTGNDMKSLLEEAKKTGDYSKVINAKMPWSRFKS